MPHPKLSPTLKSKYQNKWYKALVDKIQKDPNVPDCERVQLYQGYIFISRAVELVFEHSAEAHALLLELNEQEHLDTDPDATRLFDPQ